MRLLLVEDDPMIGQAMLSVLRAENHAVDWVRDSEMADAALRDQSYDLMLLDLGLPLRDGLQLLREVRRRRVNLPVLVVTARDAVSDRVAGLDAGADDYLVKPFDTDELLARVRALHRRQQGQTGPLFEHRGVSLNPATHEAHLHGEPVSLSAREWAVLEPLISRPGVILSRAQLEEKLFSWKDEVSSNAVEVYIHGVRKKLGADFIQTVRGLGYLVPRE
jgi:two-component system OmpR family response regulator